MSVTVGAAHAVGPAFGRERRINLSQLSAQSGEHACKHGVTTNKQTIVLDGARCVTISDMPGQRGQSIPGDLVKRFDGGTYFDQSAVRDQKGIALVHGDGLFQIHKESDPFVSEQLLAAQEATFVIEITVLGVP